MYKPLPIQHVTAKGCTTAYVDSAPEASDKPIVLCLHGVPTSSFMYRNVIDDLSFDARVIAPDLPGFGKSQKIVPWELHFEEYEKWLGSFIEQVIPEDAKINFILHDISGPFGLSWIISHPDRVQSLLLLNTTVFLEHFRPPIAALAGMLPGVSQKVISTLMHGYLLREGLRREFNCPMDMDLLEHYCAPYRDSAARTALSNLFENYRHSFGYLSNVRHHLDQITSPCTILFGAKDKYCKPSNATAFGSKIYGAYTRFLQEVGHFVAEEAPYVVAEEMRHLIALSQPETEPATEAVAHRMAS